MIGVFDEIGVFSGAGVFDGTGVLGNGVFEKSDDPLEGIPYILRLQTHRGDNIPLGINPLAGAPNSTWSGIVGSSSQPIETKRPETQFDGSTPYLGFDGVDDWMSIGDFGMRSYTYSVLLRSRSPNFNGFWSPIDKSYNATTDDRWGLFAQGTTQFHNDPFPQSVRLNGTPLASPFNLGDITEWMILTVKTAAPTLGASGDHGIAQFGQAYFGDCDYIAALIFDDENPSAEDIEKTESYLSTLVP